ncbi:nifR3 family TIM-barrel protein/tRNA dihydrouridine synthase A [Dysgonomonas alginatilytica]|uniref:tRNA-dihydrouridine synthase n=1 Tax=Dysgonomonas alginatilytica TaxID=1605892 RepID=A0A2V3PUT1_9BACT|nr:tRNA dihydrouridine synthase DusB [Dysgonomonas alginatilytica]PXV67454.1 nifR3 family TIM-barrel protein/tRNA dihydrouridine synthase A [Dysgonomonas alginatilytica]
MKISNINFTDQPVFLAPMEDVTDMDFRVLCKEFGADMVYTEFVSSDALIRHVNKTKEKLIICEAERPVAIQIYGREVEAMVEAAKICEEAQPDIIDINFGCPVKKVAGKGAGSGMMKTPELMVEITREVVKAVNLPVTLKTRLGWDHDSKIIVELAEQLQDVGIQALTIHGRTRSQMYRDNADWSLIADVKNNQRMHIPIIGNGDVTTPEECKFRFDQTGVDAVMIGRGAIGNPWIFKEVKHFLKTGELLPDESFVWYLNILKDYIKKNVDHSGERGGIIHSRRHLAASNLFKGIPDFKKTRIAMLRAATLDELFSILDSIPGEFGLE